jgi:hypothetical protein
MRSDSNVLQHFFLRHLQHDRAIPKARWGECAGKLALPFALTGATWTPVSSEGPAGVQPTAVSGSFLAIFVCWRAKRGTSPATGPDFWEATRKPEPRAPRANTNECWPFRPGHPWWPLDPVWSPARHPESGSHRHPPDRGTLPTMTLSFAPERDRDVAAVAPPALREEREGARARTRSRRSPPAWPSSAGPCPASSARTAN